MRLRSSLLVIVLGTAGCTAIDNFGKFTIGDGGSSAGSGCSGGCACIPADVSLNVPAHCYVAPANGITCSATGSAPTIMLSGNYTLDTTASPPALAGPGLPGNLSGSLQGNNAVFCVGSLVADATTKITVVGAHAVVIAALSLIQLSGTIRAGGGYSSDETGALGVAGGAPGGASNLNGGGQAGGHGGMPGAGGGGAGNATMGFAGGASSVSSNTPGGNALMPPTFGSGGGGGGAGSGKGGGGGGGGGIVQLSAGYMLKLSNAGIDVTGGGGGGGAAGGTMGPTPAGGGGGGGGAGGIIFLDSPNVSVDNGCLSVFGGPGGDGGGGLVKGRNTAQRLVCPFDGGPIGGVINGAGGLGGAPAGNDVSAGQSGSGMGGGGGGVGSFGRVIVRSKTQPTTLPGSIVSPNQPQAFQFLTLP